MPVSSWYASPTNWRGNAMSASTARKSLVRATEDGERRWFFGGGRHIWQATADDASGAFLLFECRLGRGTVPPPPPCEPRAEGGLGWGAPRGPGGGGGPPGTAGALTPGAGPPGGGGARRSGRARRRVGGGHGCPPRR